MEMKMEMDRNECVLVGVDRERECSSFNIDQLEAEEKKKSDDCFR